MNKKLILLYFVLSSMAVTGQDETWSLQRCLETGLQNNMDLKVKRLAISRAEKEFFPVLMTYLPSASFNANHSYNMGSTIDPFTNNRISSDIQYDNFYLSSNMPILNFENLAQAKVNKVAVDWTKADEAVVEYEYNLQLTEKYFDVLYTQELLKIQQQQMENTRYNIERIEKEFSLGKRPKSDVYDMQLSYTQELKSLKSTEQLFTLQTLQLFQLMNTDMPTGKVAFLPVYVEHSESMEEASLENNPLITRAELDYEMSNKKIAVLRAGLLPRLGAYYSFSTFYSRTLNGYASSQVADFEAQIDFNKNHQAGLELTIPIFNGFKTSRAVRVAKIERDQKKIATESEKLKLKQQIAEEQTKMQQYTDLQEILDSTVVYAQKSYAATQAKFESNIVETVTFSSVKNQLLSAQYDALKNELLVQFTQLKINLIRQNDL